MKNVFLFIILFLLAGLRVIAQVAINADGSLPDTSSMLDVKSNEKGVLVPRMSQSQRNAIPGPATGLLIYQTVSPPSKSPMTILTDSPPGFYYNSGTPWAPAWLIVGTGSGWGLSGNSGTTLVSNFIGTTDNQDIIFKRNNERAAYIGLNNTSFGINSLNPLNTGTYNTAIGGGSLLLNTTGNNNTAIGNGSLLVNTTGYDNSGNGVSTLRSNTSGYQNTASGTDALYSNTTGFDNTATGQNALYSNTTGNTNSANGYNALFSNTTGNYNTANGVTALESNTTGYNNTANGNAALYSNTTGFENTGNGIQALYFNTTGSNNTSVGVNSLLNNTTGNYNTALGDLANGLNTTGSLNTACGAKSLYSNKANSRSTAIGHSALFYADNRTTGRETFNTAVGYEALKGSSTASANTGQWNTAIGDQALFVNSTGDRNTGTGYHALYSNTTGYQNTAIGFEALHYNTTGYFNTACGMQALEYNTEGIYNTGVGYLSGPVFDNLTNTSTLGYDALVTASNCVIIGNPDVTWIGGQVGWSTISDERFKRNVKENVPGLDFILKLRPVTYQWDIKKLDAYRGSPGSLVNNEIMTKARTDQETIVYTGFLAQQVEKAANETGYNFSGVHKPANDKTPYSLTYESFTVPLVKSVQEQQALIEADKARISTLEERNSASEAKIITLEEKNRQLENRLKSIEEKLKLSN
jgi:trimeric autotransporter adhesin